MTHWSPATCAAGRCAVTAHLRVHGWTKAAYCEAFGLERGQSLEGPQTRKLRAAALAARLVFDPAVREGSAAGRSRAHRAASDRQHHRRRDRPEPPRRRDLAAPPRTGPDRACRETPRGSPARGAGRPGPRLRQHHRLCHRSPCRRLDLAGHVRGIRTATVVAETAGAGGSVIRSGHALRRRRSAARVRCVTSNPTEPTSPNPLRACSGSDSEGRPAWREGAPGSRAAVGLA
jgi:hypothetical protein